MKNKNTKFVILFLIIILAGFFLRVSFLDKEDFWIDEGFTMFTATEDSFEDVTKSVLYYETAPPLYFYILNPWVKLFGDSPFSARYVSMLFGVFSIFLVFMIAEKISNKKIAILTSLLFAISLVNIWISQEARPYSLAVFLSLLSTLFFVKIVKGDKRNLIYFAYFLSLVLCLYTFYLLVFVAFFHLMYLLFVKNYKVLKKIFLIQFVSGLSLIFWLIFALPGYSIRQNLVNDILIKHAKIPEFIAQFGQFALISPLIFLSFLIIIFYFINLKFPLGKLKFNCNLLSIVIALTFLGYFLILLDFQNPFIRRGFTWLRYFVFIFPVGYFLIAKILYGSNKKIRVFVILLILLISSFGVYTYYSSNIKEDWTLAGNFIMQARDSPEGIIFVEEGGGNMFMADSCFGNMEKVEMSFRDKVLTLEDVGELTENKEFAWLVLSRNFQRGDFFKELFDKNFERLDSKKVYGIELYLYKIEN